MDLYRKLTLLFIKLKRGPEKIYISQGLVTLLHIREVLPTLQSPQHVTKYEQMLKWMVEFLSKFQGSGIKIDS